MRRALWLVVLLAVSASLAAEPCTPKHLSCAEIRDLAKRRSCELEHPVCVGEPGPPGPQGPAGPKGDPGPEYFTVPATVAPQESESARGLLGWGASYGEEHNWGAHLFGGVQFAKDRQGHNWQLQVGADYQKHDDFDATCRARCYSCTVHADGAGPWKVVASGVIVF